MMSERKLFIPGDLTYLHYPGDVVNGSSLSAAVYTQTTVVVTLANFFGLA